MGAGLLVKGRGEALEKRRDSCCALSLFHVWLKEEAKERGHEVLCYLSHLSVSPNTAPSPPTPSLPCPLTQEMAL